MASLGDSICTLVRHDSSFVRMSAEHTPQRVDEARRVYASNGHIIKSKVEGELAVTRAIGNAQLKHLIVNEPEIEHHVLCSSDSLLIMATDGLYRTYTE